MRTAALISVCLVAFATLSVSFDQAVKFYSRPPTADVQREACNRCKVRCAELAATGAAPEEGYSVCFRNVCAPRCEKPSSPDAMTAGRWL
jgi:hypothetical protein